MPSDLTGGQFSPGISPLLFSGNAGPQSVTRAVDPTAASVWLLSWLWDRLGRPKIFGFGFSSLERNSLSFDGTNEVVLSLL